MLLSLLSGRAGLWGHRRLRPGVVFRCLLGLPGLELLEQRVAVGRRLLGAFRRRGILIHEIVKPALCGCADAMRIEDGKAIAPERPGHGVVFDWKRLDGVKA